MDRSLPAIFSNGPVRDMHLNTGDCSITPGPSHLECEMALDLLIAVQLCVCVCVCGCGCVGCGWVCGWMCGCGVGV